MNHFYEAELGTICDQLVLMGQRSLEGVRMATHALMEDDCKMSQKVLELDDYIDQLEKTIDNKCVRYISLRAPVASDVRLLVMAMKTSHDFERVGDEATSIAKRVPRLGSQLPAISREEYLPHLLEQVLEQLQGVIHAFISRDLQRAYRVTQNDRAIDELHREHIRSVIEHQGTIDVQAAIDLIFISKSLERVGDHAKNVAEEIIFLLEGDDVRHTPDMRHTAAV